MKNLLTKVTILFIVSHFIILYSSCRKDLEEIIRIGVLEGPSAVSFIPLIDKPHVIDGKRIEIVIKSEPSELRSLMEKQKLDFAVIPTVMAANLYNNGIKYRMVACPVWGTLYIVTNNENIRFYEDLYDKDISIFGEGSTAHLLLKHNLEQKQINCRNIDCGFKTNQELADALTSNQIEVAVLSEPLVSLIMDENPQINIVEQLCIEKFADNSPGNNAFVQTAFMVSDGFVRKNSYLISEVCNLYANSCNFVRENSEKASNLLVQNNHAKNLNVASQSIELCNIEYVSAFAIQREIQYYLQFFHDLDPASIGGRQPKSDFIYHVYR